MNVVNYMIDYKKLFQRHKLIYTIIIDLKYDQSSKWIRIFRWEMSWNSRFFLLMGIFWRIQFSRYHPLLSMNFLNITATTIYDLWTFKWLPHDMINVWSRFRLKNGKTIGMPAELVAIMMTELIEIVLK